MKGPAAFPTQYAPSIIAFVVIRFVWPAVTCETQDNDSTKPVVPTPLGNLSVLDTNDDGDSYIPVVQ